MGPAQLPVVCTSVDREAIGAFGERMAELCGRDFAQSYKIECRTQTSLYSRCNWENYSIADVVGSVIKEQTGWSV